MTIKYILSFTLFFLISGCAVHTPQPKFQDECVSSSTRKFQKEIFDMMNVNYRYFESDLSLRQFQNSFGYLYRKDMTAINSARDLMYQVKDNSQKLLEMKRDELKKYNDQLCTMPYGISTIEKEISILESALNPQSGIFFVISEDIDNSKRLYLKIKKKNEAEIAEKIMKENTDINRKKSYLSLKSGKYQIENALIQVEDFKGSTLTLSVKNISKNKIIRTNFSYCEITVNELGGEECLWLSNGLKAIDQYENKYVIYGHHSQNLKIHPNEKKVIKIGMERPLTSSMLTLKIPRTSLGSSENITLKFPADFNSK